MTTLTVNPATTVSFHLATKMYYKFAYSHDLQAISPIAGCSMDTFQHILDESALPWLSVLQGASQTMRQHIHAHIHHRLLTVLTPFGIPVKDLFRILRRSDTVISGSLALHFMLPASARTWTPRDMDLYTNSDGFHKIMALLILNGYDLVEEFTGAQRARPLGAPPMTYEIGWGIKRIVKMHKDTHSIDIIVSRTGSPILPIFHFHSTAVMNFISAYGFLSAYPKLTSSLISIVNPVAYPGTIPTPRIQSCLNKYTDRGFTCLHLQGPGCGFVGCLRPGCPEPIRSTRDNHCLFVPFDFDPNMPRVYRYDHNILWCLGAESCDNRYEDLEAFVLADNRRGVHP